ncbi:Adenylate cyclase [Paenibacillus pasadenensis]|uniref:Adenylate cyclase n=2 Tax=Paenibacillus TaxID=44249 RepID=A0A2N5N4Q8_9BACL|nr:Adenylate cyclase [Paenibacillus pasadenensis]
MGLLLLMAYGSLALRLDADGTELELKRGDMAYAPPGSLPSVHAGSGRMQELYLLGIEADCASVRELGLPSQGALLHTLRLDWMVGRLRTLLEEDSDREPGYRVRGEGIALEIAALWSREAHAGRPTPVAERHLERMKAYIQDKYREKVTKEDLGRCIGRTPNYAATLFRQGTGQTISGYVHAQRMRTAVYMLSESLLTIEEIADYLGYGEVSYFQRIFGRTFGMPPSRYAGRSD